MGSASEPLGDVPVLRMTAAVPAGASGDHRGGPGKGVSERTQRGEQRLIVERVGKAVGDSLALGSTSASSTPFFGLAVPEDLDFDKGRQ